MLKLAGSAAMQGDTSVYTADPGIVMVDAVTDRVPVRGLVLLAIDNDDGYPSCKDAWTITSYDTSPIQLCAERKPGVRFREASAYPTQQTLLRQLWQAIVA
ncbi:hypothetical protein WJX79_008945 [Trebouxia sp. C0005]